MIRRLTERSPLHFLNTTRHAEHMDYYEADYISSPEMSPKKSVPQIRIDMEPDGDYVEDNTFYWKGRRSETSL